MDKLDLRQVGTLFGNPIYVDLAGVHNLKEDSVLSTRDKEEYKVRKALQKAFQMPTTEPSETEKAVRDGR